MGDGDEEGGRYQTPAHLSTIDQTQVAMQAHIEAHKLLQTVQTGGNGSSGPGHTGAGSTRAPKAEIPKLEMNLSAQEWDRWMSAWKRYKKYARLVDQADICFNLWSSFSQELEIAAGDDGLGEEEALSEEGFLKRVRRLAVKSTNTLVSQVCFFKLGQDRGEPAAAYLARLRGAAASCKFQVKCTSCGVDTSYAETILSHQLVRGLVDSDVQEKILSKAADKDEELSLQDITSTVEALEMAKRDQVTLTGGSGGLNRQGVKEKTGPSQGPKGDKCSNCGSGGHRTGDPGCRAKEMACRGCLAKGHLVALGMWR